MLNNLFKIVSVGLSSTTSVRSILLISALWVDSELTSCFTTLPQHGNAWENCIYYIFVASVKEYCLSIWSLFLLFLNLGGYNVVQFFLMIRHFVKIFKYVTYLPPPYVVFSLRQIWCNAWLYFKKWQCQLVSKKVPQTYWCYNLVR